MVHNFKSMDIQHKGYDGHVHTFEILAEIENVLGKYSLQN